ncbi:MAG TPA: Uma2 family endonuclease, partial [Tepidisphaeraceae bacterium]|nr:Uma2 family endonuclease [Tepidisphaeraceae bacterium]
MSSLSVNAALDSGTPIKLRRITVDEYHRMIRDGYFADKERFELIDGLILEKISKNPPHETARQRARKQIEHQLPDGVTLRSEAPVTLSLSEPEPDLSIVRGCDEAFITRHPNASDVICLIEVSDSTLELDRGMKLADYAREGIAPYIIVNLKERCVIRFDQPNKDSYA